jgi:hypothetical protein
MNPGIQRTPVRKVLTSKQSEGRRISFSRWRPSISPIYLYQHFGVGYPLQQLSLEGQRAVSDLSQRYNLSREAVEHMLISVNNGAGSMAQFNCPELGGSGQWMRGGMIMVGDMFNTGLKITVDNLCNELSNLLASIQVFPVVPAGTPGSAQWWPANLGTPFSSGAQNSTQYAVFPNRLAVEIDGQVAVYDTLDHNIGGVSQQQGGDSSLSFSSQYGTISVASLPIISGASIAPSVNTNFATPEQSQEPQNAPSLPIEPSTNYAPANDDSTSVILALIEKLGQLHEAGVLDNEEFKAKKQELLARL